MAATKELLMEPTLAAGHDDLRGLRLDLLRSATEIYLGLAYPGRGSRSRRAAAGLARRTARPMSS